MIYQKFSASEQLQPYVVCYFVWESRGRLETELVVESPPTGYCSIVFNYGDVYSLKNSKYAKLQVPRQFVSGQSIYSYELFLNGVIGIAGIVLKPAALATLFNLPAYNFTEERISLSDVFPKEAIEPYINGIETASDTAKKINVLESFLLHQLHTRQPSPDFIDHAANLIIEKRGLLNIAGLVKDGCMSRRTFERRFFQKVGLSPKYYARIIRIGYIFNLIAGKQVVNWKDLFYEYEFYDQAHFIKDFQEFTGRSPQQYLQNNAELANYVAKPRQQSHNH